MLLNGSLLLDPISIASLSFPHSTHLTLPTPCLYDIMLRFGIVQTAQKADIERGSYVSLRIFIFDVHNFLTISVVMKVIK